MKKGGSNIFRSASRFFKDVFLKNINKSSVGSILVLDSEEKVGSSPYLSTEKNKINIGNKSEDTFEIQRARTSSGLGVGLNIKAGDAFGTDKAGGDLNLYGGASTGATNGGSIRLFQAARSSSSDTLNTWSELFNTELTNSRINFTGIGTLGGISKVESNGNIVLSVDYDNNGSSDYFAIMDAAVTRLFMPTSSGGNMYLMSASNSTGIFLDAINSRISAGSQAAHSGTDADTDNTGGANATGKTLTLAGGAGTGSGAGGGISFGTYPAGSSGLTANSSFSEKMSMDKDGNLEIGGNLTVNGTTTTVNTATLDVEDKNITLNYHASSDTSGTADGAGITIQDAVDASNDATILWTAASDTFTFSHNINATLATAAQTNITSLGTLTALTVDNITIDGDTITGSSGVKILGDTTSLESSIAQKPELILRGTANSNKPAAISFVKDKGAAGADGDNISLVTSTADNDAQEQITFVSQSSIVADASDGAEEGQYTISIKNTNSAGVSQSFALTGNGAATDAAIGFGASSVTTVAGTLTIGSTAFVNNSGVIQVATQGTIDHDSLANFVAAEHYRWDNDISATATINAANIPTLNQNTSGTAAGLSSTLAVGSGGTGTTSYTDNQIVAYNAGTGKLEGHNVFITTPSSNIHRLIIGDVSNTVSSQLMSDNGAPLTVLVDFASGSNVAGSDLTLQAGVSTGTEAGGDIVFRSSPTGSSGSIPNANTEIAKLDNVGNLQLDGGITTGSTSFVNSSGVVQVATQGTIDHDSLANFVAAEHYRWDNDISGTATINAANIPTLNQNTTGTAATVTGAAQTNITSLGTLTALQVDNINLDGETMTIGVDDDGAATIKRTPHTDDGGGDLYIRGGDATSGQTNKAGGALQLFGGRATGNAAGGAVIIQAGETNASSGTTLRGSNVIASFRADGDTLLQGNLIFEGASPDAHETTFSITDPTADRTITVPNASGTMAFTNASHHFLNAGFFLSFPYSRYIPLNGSINEQNTSTSSPEYTHFTWPYDGFVKKMMLRTETDMGSTELKLYKGASGAAVTTALGAVTETVAASNAVEFDFTSVSNTYSKGDTMAVRVDPTDDPDGGQNITIELVFDLTT